MARAFTYGYEYCMTSTAGGGDGADDGAGTEALAACRSSAPWRFVAHRREGDDVPEQYLPHARELPTAQPLASSPLTTPSPTSSPATTNKYPQQPFSSPA
ncbi:hypothetical protein O9K51_07281 [Purpureocillium lavendulum]|uniref:Uncharacterized protein n=1 Tax=Purpureocillium lavendulum TaxID=1247861 RepID=A0AB34FKM0_9HYPO|nr:hypothetical protein O9K51_07281 [Purpureocillium lavendulum]